MHRDLRMESSKAKAKAKAKPHVVCVPLPVQGHIRPMLNLAKLLHSKGFHITFVNTEFNHARLLHLKGSNSLHGIPSFKFQSIPDGLPPSDPDATQDIPALCHAILNFFLEPFKNLILSLNADSSSPPVTLILSDCVMPFTQDVAQHLGGIPVALLWTASVNGFLAGSQFRALLDKGIVPFKDSNYETDGSLDMILDWVPNSMKGIQLKYIPSFIRTTYKDDIMFNFFMNCVERAAKSCAPIIFNSFDAFEHEVMEDISKIVGGSIYNIGPLQLHVKCIEQDSSVASLGSNLWKEDEECLQWLDSKKPGSVVYVSYGSITTMTNQNLMEFAWGLANSNHPFLWIVRRDIVTEDSAVIPSEFLMETRERGVLATWCDQEKVLSHPSIGAFLTHCGWNSTLDTVCSGVPILCWPFFAEQQTNCWFSSEKWGIGIEVENEVRREQVERQVRELMEGQNGKQIRKNVIKWKKLAEEAITCPTGSSYLSFESLITQLTH